MEATVVEDDKALPKLALVGSSIVNNLKGHLHDCTRASSLNAVHPKLAWTEELRNVLSVAGMGLTITVEDDVDPLKKLVVLHLNEELKKGDYAPIQSLAHGFAKANDCVLAKIRRGPKRLTLEILVKTRLGPVMNKSPLG